MHQNLLGCCLLLSFFMLNNAFIDSPFKVKTTKIGGYQFKFKKFPNYFLMSSILCFSISLCIFVYVSALSSHSLSLFFFCYFYVDATGTETGAIEKIIL